MKYVVLLLAGAVTLVAVGCGRPERREPVSSLSTPQIVGRPVAPAEAEALWQGLTEGVPLEEPVRTKFFSQGKGPSCPKVKVATARGEKVAIQPGRLGHVTLVVFWRVDSSGGRTAVRYVNDLAHKYRELSVRGIGIAEKTQPPVVAAAFAARHGITLPFYYDDLSALEEMSEEVDAEEETAVPSVFIIDREMRIRFYRAGFRYAVGARGRRMAGEEMVYESAPAGKSIEDYLRLILGES